MKPNKLIVKPIFAVMVLKRSLTKIPAGMDWKDRKELMKIWFEVRG